MTHKLNKMYNVKNSFQFKMVYFMLCTPTICTVTRESWVGSSSLHNVKKF